MAVQALAVVWALLLAPLLAAAAEVGGEVPVAVSTAVAQAAADAREAAAEAAEAAASDSTPECAEKKDPHGQWNGTRIPGGRYTLTCSHGFAVDGKSSLTLSCTNDVQWPADPWCENVDDCAKLVHACGPAGLCVDHEGWAECLCENGAIMHNTSHGEVVCYFKHENKHCGGRNCGAHGICIDLTEFQDSFDSGVGQGSFRCSCEQGFHDDGTSCVAVDCGPRVDELGKWTGETTYQGEYTLECDEGAFLWGGSQQAITITCPSDGVWKLHPVCRSREELLRHEEWERFLFWINIVMATVCVCCAAVAAGLTMGLVSLDERELEIIDQAELSDCNDELEQERLQSNKDAAKRIAPILTDHHRLLVTLLLLNALANEALPIFLDDLMPPWLALLVSVTFVLLCGEIIPSAIFTGPMQMTVAARFIPCVECLQTAFSAVARPIAGALDKYLPHDEDQLYSRPEIKAVICLHSQGGDPREKGRPQSPSRVAYGEQTPTRQQSRDSTIGSRDSATPFIASPPLDDSPRSVDSSPSGETVAKGNPNAPLTSLEAELCLNTLRLGEQTLHASEGFCSLRVCSSACLAVDSTTKAAVALKEAAEAGKPLLAVFQPRARLKWPAEVHVEDLVGVLSLAQLLTEEPNLPVGRALAGRRIARLKMEDTILVGLNKIKAVGGIGGECCGFGAVEQRGEFAGLLDGERALMELLGRGHRQEPLGPRRLDTEVQQAVLSLPQVVALREAAGREARDLSPRRRRMSGPAISLSLDTVHEAVSSRASLESAATAPREPVAAGEAQNGAQARAIDSAQPVGMRPVSSLPLPGACFRLAEPPFPPAVLARRLQGTPESAAADAAELTANAVAVAIARVTSESPSTSSVGAAGSMEPTPSVDEEAFVVGALSSYSTYSQWNGVEYEETMSPAHSRSDGPLRNEIQRAYFEYQQDLEAVGHRTPSMSAADASPAFVTRPPP